MASPRKPATFTGDSPLAPLMAQFIQEKRACGYRYNPGVCSLRRLDAHLCRQGLPVIPLPELAPHLRGARPVALVPRGR